MFGLLIAQVEPATSPVDYMAFATYGFLALIILVPVIAHYWTSAIHSRHEMELKRHMVERGFTAEEILAVLAGDAKHLRNAAPSENASPAKPLKSLSDPELYARERT